MRLVNESQSLQRHNADERHPAGLEPQKADRRSKKNATPDYEFRLIVAVLIVSAILAAVGAGFVGAVLVP